MKKEVNYTSSNDSNWDYYSAWQLYTIVYVSHVTIMSMFTLKQNKNLLSIRGSLLLFTSRGVRAMNLLGVNLASDGVFGVLECYNKKIMLQSEALI